MAALTDAAGIVRACWAAMNSNDFAAVAAAYLTADCRIFWPQSAEVIDGRAAFAAINLAYPAQEKWRFQVLSLLAEGDRAVLETRITDGSLTALAITFHRIDEGRIAEQIEYWPETYPAPAWRAAWVSTGLPERCGGADDPQAQPTVGKAFRPT